MRAATAALICALALGAGPAFGQSFRRPVACSTCIANWYYFDQAAAAGAVQDWSCAGSSYDGHRGSDFSLAGNNAAIDAGHDVVAVADGEVVSSEDGYYDRCTACGGDGCGRDYGWGYGNHVVINHGAYRVIYAHLRTGSVRVSGGAVSCGQVIGQIGSSGCSTGAHLHFEVRPRDGASSTAFDPFQGPCSPTSPGLWTDQGSHRGLPSDSCGGPPPPTCPEGTSEHWTCTDGGSARRRCLDGDDQIEDCPWGCTSSPDRTDDVCAEPPDGDGDGHTADVDCDDADPTRYPGAPEICGDGIDQDCDGIDPPCPDVDAAPILPDGGPDARPEPEGNPGAISGLRGGCGATGRPGPWALARLVRALLP